MVRSFQWSIASRTVRRCEVVNSSLITYGTMPSGHRGVSDATVNAILHLRCSCSFRHSLAVPAAH
jgi:hypothetical protein